MNENNTRIHAPYQCSLHESGGKHILCVNGSVPCSEDCNPNRPWFNGSLAVVPRVDISDRNINIDNYV
jgi:hypothetical protein